MSTANAPAGSEVLQELIKARRRLTGAAGFLPGWDLGRVEWSIDELLNGRKPDLWLPMFWRDDMWLFFVLNGSLVLWRLRGADIKIGEGQPEVEVEVVGPVKGGKYREILRLLNEDPSFELDVTFEHDRIPGDHLLKFCIRGQNELDELSGLRRFLRESAEASPTHGT